jgi:hypothetical protein
MKLRIVESTAREPPPAASPRATSALGGRRRARARSRRAARVAAAALGPLPAWRTHAPTHLRRIGAPPLRVNEVYTAAARHPC